MSETGYLIAVARHVAHGNDDLKQHVQVGHASLVDLRSSLQRDAALGVPR